MSRLSKVVTDIVKLNVESSSAVLSLLTNYVKAVDGIIRSSGEMDAGDAPNKPASETSRPPVLLVGTAGEVAGGAFILNNTSQNDLSVTFAVQGELAETVQLTPTSVTLRAGESTAIRVSVPITEKFAEGRDYFGMVFVPGLSNQVVDLVVRRLPAARASNGS